jgi:hypothetical protein
VQLKRLRFYMIGFALVWFLSAGMSGQVNAPPQVPTIPERQEPSEAEKRAEQQMAKMANEKRQADLKRDTDQLLKLATELKENVDKTNGNILSVDVIKKAEEIEKLAHSVKQKMKGE